MKKLILAIAMVFIFAIASAQENTILWGYKKVDDKLEATKTTVETYTLDLLTLESKKADLENRIAELTQKQKYFDDQFTESISQAQKQIDEINEQIAEIKK